MIYQVLRNLFNLCLLRASPAELPYSLVILVILVSIGTGLNVFTLLQLKGIPLSEVLLATSLSLVLLVTLIYFLLARRKMVSRLPKVLMAWFGTEILLAALLKIILIITPESIQAMKGVQIILQLGFFTWNVVIKAFIVRHSCEIKMVSALLLTFGILVLSSLPIQFILGPYLAEAIPSS
ncbi:MAG: hypothetical protein JSS07_04340 [Proteobacteria bacterium]|nr:hypothetical protein [Pseudomonadota bacterium]